VPKDELVGNRLEHDFAPVPCGKRLIFSTISSTHSTSAANRWLGPFPQEFFFSKN
jgi:hypothetical protein